jgi:hypothetical protein
MAVAAINAEARDVVLMTERHRLLFAHARVSNVRRTLQLIQEQEQRSDHEDRTEQ